MQLTSLRVLSSIACILIIIATVQLNDHFTVWSTAALDTQNDSVKTAGCTIQNNRCVFVVDQQKFDLKFLQTPVTEEEIRFSLTSSDEFMLTKSWIEGINMFMGKTPVIVEQQSGNSIVAIFFLGSCNLKTMEWRMVVNIENKTHPVEVRFTTSN